MWFPGASLLGLRAEQGRKENGLGVEGRRRRMDTSFHSPHPGPSLGSFLSLQIFYPNCDCPEAWSVLGVVHAFNSSGIGWSSSQQANQEESRMPPSLWLGICLCQNPAPQPWMPDFAFLPPPAARHLLAKSTQLQYLPWAPFLSCLSPSTWLSSCPTTSVPLPSPTAPRPTKPLRLAPTSFQEWQRDQLCPFLLCFWGSCPAGHHSPSV